MLGTLHADLSMFPCHSSNEMILGCWDSKGHPNSIYIVDKIWITRT